MISKINKKNIWIINYYTAPSEYAYNQRYIKIIPFLINKGYNITVISSSYLRRHNIDLSEGKQYCSKEYNGVSFIHIKSLKYEGNGIKRMLSIFFFSIKLLFIPRKYGKPEIIYHNIHTPFDSCVYLLSRRFKADYIVEAWDLWPEFFYKLGLIKKNHILMRIAYAIEKYLYIHAKKIVFTFEGGGEYFINKKWDIKNGGKIDLSKIEYINNGVDLKQFEIDKNNHWEYGNYIDKKFFNIIYIGSMHKTNCIDNIIYAAELLKYNTQIRFYLYGDGSERLKLENYCSQCKLDNVFFKDNYVPFNFIASILSRSSLNILNYHSNFGEYGVSSGKLFLYLAAGKPILSNTAINYCIIKKYNLGISRDLDNPQIYAKSILEIMSFNEEEYMNICVRVYNTARQFEYELLAGKLINVFEN